GTGSRPAAAGGCVRRRGGRRDSDARSSAPHAAAGRAGPRRPPTPRPSAPPAPAWSRPAVLASPAIALVPLGLDDVVGRILRPRLRLLGLRVRAGRLQAPPDPVVPVRLVLALRRLVHRRVQLRRVPDGLAVLVDDAVADLTGQHPAEALPGHPAQVGVIVPALLG